MAKPNPVNNIRRIQALKGKGPVGKKKYGTINMVGQTVGSVESTKNKAKTKYRVRSASPVNPMAKPK